MQELALRKPHPGGLVAGALALALALVLGGCGSATSSSSTRLDSSGITTAADAGEVVVKSATARPNEDGGSSVFGGQETRLTWEGTVNVDSGITEVTLALPDDATFDGSTTRVTVLDGLKRVNIDSTTSTNGNTITIKFAEAIPSGSLLRLEVTNMKFPTKGGSYSVTGTYVTGTGEKAELDASPKITITELTTTQAIVNWLDGQAWVAAWNSVPFLNMFFKPQLLVTSFPSLFSGWILCLIIILVAFPFGILLGLVFAFMRISKHRWVRAIAAIYVNLLRGTPLFLQIYIAFFGLPMVGINMDNNILGIIVVAINSSAYQAEIYRAGIQSIPKGQYEAATSLGMTYRQTMISIILPQTVRRVLPTVTSDFITSYKDTSLLSSVGVMELMMFSKNLTTVSGNITPYIAAAIYYLIVTLPLIKVVGIIEHRLSADENGDGPRPKDDDMETEDEFEAPAADEKAKPSAFQALTAPFRAHTLSDGGVEDAI